MTSESRDTYVYVDIQIKLKYSALRRYAFLPTLVMTPRILFLLSPFIVSGICLNVQSYNTISVDPSSGRDDSRCLDPLSGIRCETLSYALRYANHSTLYLLSAAREQSLVASEPNTLANLRDITIASNGTSSTVRCARNAGLSFENVSSLAIENVVFFGCGTSHNSTSRNLSDTESPYTLLKFTVALYFQLCDSVSLRHVTVTNSFGMGVIMYDTTGKNLISNSVFSNNVAQDRTTPGGGGFALNSPTLRGTSALPRHHTTIRGRCTTSRIPRLLETWQIIFQSTFQRSSFPTRATTTRLVKEEVSLCSLKGVPRTIRSDCPTAHFKTIIGGQVR